MTPAAVPAGFPPAARKAASPARTTRFTLRNRHRAWRVDLRLLHRLAQAACAELPVSPADGEGKPSGEVAVLLVNGPSMARLNERFLGHAGPTDVITFDYAEPRPRGRRGPTLHGDLFICLDEARRQATQFRTTWPAEVVRYLVHGLLHLRGYDDREPAARRVMKREENRIVRRLASRFPFNRLERAGNVRP